MTDKDTFWTREFHLNVGHPTTLAEKAFLRDAEKIAQEVAGMSDKDVADYLLEHDLQALVAPERVEMLVTSALQGVHQCHQIPEPAEASPEEFAFAVRINDRANDEVHNESTKRTAGGNVVHTRFGVRGGTSD